MPEQPESMPRRRPPTIRDVAERAGVSKSLVSLVLRDSPRVGDKSRTTIQQAIDDLHYRPSAIARSLVSHRSGILGIITSSAHDFFYADVVAGISSYVETNQSRLIPLILHGNCEKPTESRAVDRFLELRAEGLMLMGSALTDDAIERLGSEVATATIGRWVSSHLVDVVVNDDGRGAAIATRHLLDLGHRRIAHITGGTGNGSKEREAGFRRTMEEAGCQPIVTSGGYLQRHGAEGARRLLEAPDRLPTAIFAANDLAAIGAMDALYRAGRRVPEDISVIGYDDITLAGLGAIDLTTVNQPARQMGETAARLVCERLDDTFREAQMVLIEPALVVRSTTRPI